MPTPVASPSSRRRWIWVTVVLMAVAGANLRTAAVRTALRTGEHLTGDSYSYFLVAYSVRELVSPSDKPPPKWMNNGVFVRGVVYPAVIALSGGGTAVCARDILASHTPFRCPVNAILVMNVILAFLGCILTFVVGDRLRSAAVGLVACALVAFSPDLIDMTVWVMTEPFRLPFVLIGILALDRFRQHSSFGTALTAGALTTFLAVSHSASTFVVFPIFLWVCLVVRPRSLGTYATFLAPSLVAAVAWVVASQAQFGELVMPGTGGKGFAGGGAWTAMIASRPENDGAHTPADEDYVVVGAGKRLLERLDSGGKDPKLPPLEPEIADWIRLHGVENPIPDSVFWKVIINRFRAQPAAFAWLTVKKIWRLTSVPASTLVLGNRGPIPGSYTFHRLVLLLGVVGIFWPRTSLSMPNRTLLLVIPAFMVLVFSLAYPNPRYWTLALPILSIFAAIPLEAIGLRIYRKNAARNA